MRRGYLVSNFSELVRTIQECLSGQGSPLLTSVVLMEEEHLPHSQWFCCCLATGIFHLPFPSNWTAASGWLG